MTQVGAAIAYSGVLYNAAGSVLTILRAFKDVTGLGDTELVPAEPGKRIRVIALAIQAGLAVTVRLKSAGNNISASFALALNDDFVLPANEHGWFETNVNEALTLNASAIATTGVQLVYVLV